MPTVIYVNFNDSSPALLPTEPEWNHNILTHASAGVLMSSDLLDENGVSTGLVLRQVTTAPTSSIESAGFATSGAGGWPESVFDSKLVWNIADNTCTLRVEGLTAGQGFTIEIAGHVGNTRSMNFDVNGGTGSYVNDGDSTPSAPLIITGSADANGHISINADATVISGYIDGFKLTVDDAITLTPDQANVKPADAITWTTSLTGLTGAYLEDGSGNQYNLTSVTDTGGTIPALAPLLDACLFGAVTLTVTDGTDTASAGVTLDPPTGYSVVTLTSIPDRALTGTDWIFGFDTEAVVGDQGIFLDSSPYTYNADGTISNVSAGTDTFFTVQASTGTISEITKVFESQSVGASGESQNSLLVQIIQANGGTVTNPNNRNQLLQDWLDSI